MSAKGKQEEGGDLVRLGLTSSRRDAQQQHAGNAGPTQQPSRGQVQRELVRAAAKEDCCGAINGTTTAARCRRTRRRGDHARGSVGVQREQQHPRRRASRPRARGRRTTRTDRHDDHAHTDRLDRTVQSTNFKASKASKPRQTETNELHYGHEGASSYQLEPRHVSTS
jgi:hypothetical protein